MTATSRPPHAENALPSGLDPLPGRSSGRTQVDRVPSVTDEVVVLTQMADAYRRLAQAGIHYANRLTVQVDRDKRTIESLREQLTERDAQITDLDAEITRYTRSMIAEGVAV